MLIYYISFGLKHNSQTCFKKFHIRVPSLILRPFFSSHVSNVLQLKFVTITCW